MIVGIFCMGDFVSPGTGVAFTEDQKVYFNLLVNMCYFAIGLRVVGCGEREVIVEEFSEFFVKAEVNYGP